MFALHAHILIAIMTGAPPCCLFRACPCRKALCLARRQHQWATNYSGRTCPSRSVVVRLFCQTNLCQIFCCWRGNYFVDSRKLSGIEQIWNFKQHNLKSDNSLPRQAISWEMLPKLCTKQSKRKRTRERERGRPCRNQSRTGQLISWPRGTKVSNGCRDVPRMLNVLWMPHGNQRNPSKPRPKNST